MKTDFKEEIQQMFLGETPAILCTLDYEFVKELVKEMTAMKLKADQWDAYKAAMDRLGIVINLGR